MVFRLIDESAGYTQLYYNYLVNWVRRIDSHKLDTLLLKAAKLTYSGYFFGYESKKFNYAKKKNIFDLYRKRSFFYPPHSRTPMVFCSEEIATMYHFPGGVSETPSFGRVESKKSGPPVNLPV